VDAVDCEKYRTINRDKAKSPEEKDEMTRQAMTVDYYLMSPNALTQEGELVNIDGKGNRVAALCYGPKYVIVIAGMNKLAQDRENGIWRSQNIASPKNTLRIGKQTPCSVTGECGDCYGDESICSQIVITRRSGVKNRIKVILVGEELGY
ncbi:MAG TPA: lactate utilization protein, partial [Eubacteriaceae bacterium]|nr:lactate utilization protein [Eubacteriaceae bacterium]